MPEDWNVPYMPRPRVRPLYEEGVAELSYGDLVRRGGPRAAAEPWQADLQTQMEDTFAECSEGNVTTAGRNLGHHLVWTRPPEVLWRIRGLRQPESELRSGGVAPDARWGRFVRAVLEEVAAWANERDPYECDPLHAIPFELNGNCARMFESAHARYEKAPFGPRSQAIHPPGQQPVPGCVQVVTSLAVLALHDLGPASLDVVQAGLPGAVAAHLDGRPQALAEAAVEIALEEARRSEVHPSRSPSATTEELLQILDDAAAAQIAGRGALFEDFHPESCAAPAHLVPNRPADRPLHERFGLTQLRGSQAERWLGGLGLLRDVDLVEVADRQGIAWASSTDGQTGHRAIAAIAHAIDGAEVGVVRLPSPIETRRRLKTPPSAEPPMAPPQVIVDGDPSVVLLMNPAMKHSASGGPHPTEIVVVSGVLDFIVMSAVVEGVPGSPIAVVGLVADHNIRKEDLQKLVPDDAHVYVHPSGQPDKDMTEFVANMLADRCRVGVHEGRECVANRLRSGLIGSERRHPAIGVRYRESTFPRHGSSVESALTDLLARADGRVKRVPWPWAPVQRFTGGLDREVTSLGGGTGGGKTTVALVLALHCLSLGIPVLYVLGEMSRDALYQRLLALAANVPWRVLRLGTATEAQLHRVQSVDRSIFDHLTVWSTGVQDLSGWALLGQIEAHVRGCPDSEGYPPVVVIDYLQRFAGGGQAGGGRLGSLAYRLEASSRAVGYAVLAITSVSREKAKKLLFERDSADSLVSGACCSRTAEEFQDLVKGDGDVDYATSVVLALASRHGEDGLEEIAIGVAKGRDGACSPGGKWQHLQFDGASLRDAAEEPQF